MKLLESIAKNCPEVISLRIGKENAKSRAGFTLVTRIAICPDLEIEDKLKLLESIAKNCPKVMSLRIDKENANGWAGDTLASFIASAHTIQIEHKLKLLESIAINCPEVMSLRIGKENTYGWAGFTLASFIVAYTLKTKDKLKLLKKIHQSHPNAFGVRIGEGSGKYAGCTSLPFIMVYDKPERIDKPQLICGILDECPDLIKKTPDWDSKTASAFLKLGLEITTEDKEYLKKLSILL